MTTFEDGPTKGETLHLRRAPVFLRVTQNGPCFDALDQLDDEPEETEILYVYVLVEKPRAWVLRGGCRQPIARYRFFEPQPRDSQIRQTHAWRGWTQRMAEAAKRMPA